MKAGQLKQLLADVPDETPIIGHPYDHTYREVRLTVAEALYEGRGRWCVDHGEDVTPEAEYGKRMTAIFVE